MPFGRGRDGRVPEKCSAINLCPRVLSSHLLSQQSGSGDIVGPKVFNNVLPGDLLHDVGESYDRPPVCLAMIAQGEKLLKSFPLRVVLPIFISSRTTLRSLEISPSGRPDS